MVDGLIHQPKSETNIMETRLLITKLMALVYYHSQVNQSVEITETVNKYITLIAKDNESSVDQSLLDLIRRIHACGSPYSHPKLRSEITIITDADIDWVDWVDTVLEKGQEDAVYQRLVLEELNTLRQHEAVDEISKLMSQAAYTLRHKRSTIPNVSTYVTEFMGKLETYASAASPVDNAVTLELDVSDKSGMDDVFTSAKDLKDGGKAMRFGWQALNDALQGGIRPGDCMFIGSLEHNYKSSMLRTAFRQIAQYNAPPNPDNTTTYKPLMVFFSFEDSVVIIMQFLFQNIMYNRTRKPINISDYTPEEMNKTVTEVLTANGWHVKFLRVNPTEWTYRDLLNKLISYIADGYTIHLLALDYLLQLPTTGCNTSGAMGTDLRDLVRRVRAFCASKDIPMISPAQLSTGVKDMLINGVPDRDILSAIAERGMYAGSKQITHDLDISCLIKKVKAGDATYLDVLIDKHRSATAIEDARKHFALPMPPDGMPIVDDVEEKRPIHVRKIPMGIENF